MSEHPYITAYNELGSQDKVAAKFNVTRHKVCEIVDPESFQRKREQKNKYKREKNWRKNNRKWIITRLEYLNAKHERESA